ncbi:MAG: undecaprenyl-diphosphate phosphatase [Peptostreptococcaceae bacterium]|nr:undecaprenyl-diphosphate phosphatase [Peptostreptococcaceae bacterium]
MMEIVKIIFLGIVEGITEWLPISSTGHMILVDEFLRLKASDAFKELFFVVIQLGAIMAVVVLYWNKLFPLEKKTLRKKASSTDPDLPQTKTVWVISKDKLALWGKVLIASLPAAIIGLPLDDWLDAKFYNHQTVALMLIVYGILFILVENRYDPKRARVNSLEELTIREAIFVGVFQVLALIPGTSRSGATIIGGMLAGVSRKVAAEFTFFLAIPVMFGASLLKLVKYGLAFSAAEGLYLLIGMLVAFFVSIFAIKFLIGYIKKNSFKFFGYYRIVLGAVVFLYFLFAK